MHLKRTLAALLLTLCWMVRALAGPELLPLEDGVSHAGFTLPDLQDRPHALADYRGKVVLVNFWATWCPSCIHEMPDLKQLAKTLEDEPFEILTVNVGEQKFRVWKFLRLVDFDLPVLLDSRKEVFTAWELTVLPTSFLLDRNGRIRYRVQAAPQWDGEATLAVIRQLLAEPVSTQ
ncbi:MAG: TlpA disulfide reductase family protein [Gammaproteobacteria bacterium]|jgi:thiol-disulfide isomerase/thioredoxin